MARQSLHPPLLAASSVSSGPYSFLRSSAQRLWKEPSPSASLPTSSFVLATVCFVPPDMLCVSLGGCVRIPSPSCLCIRQKRPAPKQTVTLGVRDEEQPQEVVPRQLPKLFFFFPGTHIVALFSTLQKQSPYGSTRAPGERT